MRARVTSTTAEAVVRWPGAAYWRATISEALGPRPARVALKAVDLGAFSASFGMKHAPDAWTSVAMRQARLLTPARTLVIEVPSPTLGLRTIRWFPSVTRPGRRSEEVTGAATRAVVSSLEDRGLTSRRNADHGDPPR